MLDVHRRQAIPEPPAHCGLGDADCELMDVEQEALALHPLEGGPAGDPAVVTQKLVEEVGRPLRERQLGDELDVEEGVHVVRAGLGDPEEAADALAKAVGEANPHVVEEVLGRPSAVTPPGSERAAHPPQRRHHVVAPAAICLGDVVSICHRVLKYADEAVVARVGQSGLRHGEHEGGIIDDVRARHHVEVMVRELAALQCLGDGPPLRRSVVLR
mmetsp:Transcript_22116/g.47730  ORF Transcript_22116/g.47730 Transcript_22116/m.47730 type:complete len:215 (+) Transcript_22116:393-1037(+)